MSLSKQKGFSPIFIIIGVIVLVIIAAIGFLGFKSKFQDQSNSPYDNTKIMYGYASYEDYIKSRPEFAKKADEELAAYANVLITKGEFKNMSEVAVEDCNLGYKYLGSDDDKTAIKRFNQAWLMDHNQPCIFAGYGYTMGLHTKDPKVIDESLKMYERALSLTDPSSKEDRLNPWSIYIDYAEILNYCYMSDNSRTDCLNKAQDNLAKSLAIKDSYKAHRVLAFIAFNKKNYPEAWKQVHLALDGGMKQEEFGQFIVALKKEMPDPQGKIQ